MVLGVPVSLILVYALFRMNEYYMLKLHQGYMSGGPASTRPQLVFGSVLLIARVFGWAFLLYFAYRNGWLEAVKLLAIAFPLSLAMQWAVLVPLVRFGGLDNTGVFDIMGRVGFFVLPICAVLLFVFLPPT